jgi:hypothetical protein
MSSKSGSTRVITSKLLAIAEKLGLQLSTRAGWVLACNPTDTRQRLLIHTGKKGTNCVELVSFESKAAITHPCPPAKTMTQMLDFNLTEKEILRNFFKTAKLLASSVAVKPASPAPTTAELMNDSPAVGNSSAPAPSFEEVMAKVG